MADIQLQRMYSDDDCTLGVIVVSGLRFFTLELPWLNNAPNISCVIDGKYNYKKRVSPGKGYEVIELIDVPGRSYIQIHLGNFTNQIQGCILPGTGLKDIDEDGCIDVTGSENAFNSIMENTPDLGTIEIINSFYR